MNDVYWVLPEILGGRKGPNRSPWDVLELYTSGVRMVVSLTERMLNQSEELVKTGIDHVCIALPKNAPPKLGDKENIIRLLPCVYRIVEAQIETGNGKIIVHCSSGKDRTGLFMGYFLMRFYQLSPDEAMARLEDIVPDLLSASGWREMASEVLDYFASRRP